MLRQRKPQDRPAITAAATQLPTKDPKKLGKALSAPEEWQTEAWEFFDTVPELRYSTDWRGNLIAKLKLYVAVEDADGNPVAVDAVKVDDAGNVTRLTDVPEGEARELVDLMEALKGELGGQADVQRELSENLDVAGECYLIGWAPRVGVDEDEANGGWLWEIRSISEVTVKGGVTKVLGSPKDKRGREVTSADVAVRMWVRHPRWSGLANAATQALTTEFRTLQVLTQQIMAEAMSRANAGVLLWPNEVTVGTLSGAAGDDGAPDDEEQDDPLMAQLTEYVTRAVQDPGDPSSIAPFLGRMPYEYMDRVRLVSLARDTGEALDKRIEARVQRVARGLNVPVEVVMGHRQTTFANADQVSQDEFTDHLEPAAVTICDLLTVGYLRPQATKVSPETKARVFVWYDASELMDPPDLSESADQAFDRGALSWTAYRKAKNFTEDDKPSEDELVAQLVYRKAILTADLSSLLLRYVNPNLKDLELPQSTGAPAEPVEASAMIQALALIAARQDGQLATLMELAGIPMPPAPRAVAIAATGRADPDPTSPRS